MEAITALLQRVSSGKLVDPAPDAETRRLIFSAALRAADHANLRPWRFLTFEGDARKQLGNIFAESVAALDSTLSPAQSARYHKMPLRAPLLVLAIARAIEHPKVPLVEQTVATGAALQNMITAAYALGVGAYWRTGPMAYHSEVLRRLGLQENERLIGYLYLGTPSGKPKPLPELPVEDYFKAWDE